MSWLTIFMASFLFPVMLLALLLAMDWRRQMAAGRAVKAAPAHTSSPRRPRDPQ
jgi:hypothetical protein